jgi:hypothetical protein
MDAALRRWQGALFLCLLALLVFAMVQVRLLCALTQLDSCFTTGIGYFVRVLPSFWWQVHSAAPVNCFAALPLVLPLPWLTVKGYANWSESERLLLWVLRSCCCEGCMASSDLRFIRCFLGYSMTQLQRQCRLLSCPGIVSASKLLRKQTARLLADDLLMLEVTL